MVIHDISEAVISQSILSVIHRPHLTISEHVEAVLDDFKKMNILLGITPLCKCGKAIEKCGRCWSCYKNDLKNRNYRPNTRQRKLSEEQINRIKKLHSFGMKQQAIASRMGVAQSTIADLLSGKFYKDVK